MILQVALKSQFLKPVGTYYCIKFWYESGHQVGSLLNFQGWGSDFGS